MIEANKRAKRRAAAADGLAIQLVRGNGRPLFAQVHEQVVDRIASGDLSPGMRLPPVRSLAKTLGINQMTVARAYKDLADAGFVEGRAGGGTYIRTPSGIASRRVRTPREHVENRPLLSERLFDLSHAPGVIAFTANFPVIDSACIDEFRACLEAVMAENVASCFHYDPPTGRPSLRRQIAAYLRERGVVTPPEDVVVTSGAQQAIDLVIRSLVPPGAPVIIERPAYYGVINALRTAQARVLEVPLEPDGMDIAALEMHLSRHRPRLIYTNPTFQNPTGITTSEEKRRALLALARKYGVAILEDDHNSDLRFAGTPLPSVRALAEPEDPVFHVRSFGKVFLPGVRLGYVVTPSRARRALLAIKAHSDLHTNALMQEATALFLERGNYKRPFERMRKSYGLMQKKLIRKLSEGMPSGTLIGRPEGGLSLWLNLPEGTEVSELYYRAVRRGVAFISGEVFYASHVNPRTLRVSFGSMTDEVLAEGVSRLCSVAADLMRPRGALSAIFT
jgi:DNA-binding transcriptional MocR family regulator